jgi:hypothetical protein
MRECGKFAAEWGGIEQYDYNQIGKYALAFEALRK